MESRTMGHRFERPIEILSEIELRLGAWMEKHGLLLLRIGMGTVFFWFGALKALGLSPAAALVTNTMSWLPFPGFLAVEPSCYQQGGHRAQWSRAGGCGKRGEPAPKVVV